MMIDIRHYKPKPLLVFALLLIIISLQYRYPEILFSRPQSVHAWRQSDAAAFALNYYQDGYRFHEPAIHHLWANELSDGGGGSEGPVLYAPVAILYGVFGYHEFLHRLLVLLVFYIGLFCLYLFSRQFIDDPYWAMLPPMFLFTSSTVVAFYANNFLIDPFVVSLSWAGWCFFGYYYKNNKKKHLWYAALFFALAALGKISMLINVLILIGLFIIELLGISRVGPKKTKLLAHRWTTIIPLLLSMVPTAIWYTWIVLYYNPAHPGTNWIYSTKTWPVWELSQQELFQMAEYIYIIWFKQLFNPLSWCFLGLSIIAFALWFSRANKLMVWSSLIALSAFFLFILLWFVAFKDNAYYIFNILTAPVFLVLVFSIIITRRFPSFTRSWKGYLLLGVFLAVNSFQTAKGLKSRYNSWMNTEWTRVKYIAEIQPYLEKINIGKDDKIISIPDRTFNYTLYMMNRKGWTSLTMAPPYEKWVQDRIDAGARYLVLTDEVVEVVRNPWLKKYMDHKIGQYYNVSIYCLQDCKGMDQSHANDYQRVLKTELLFDAENFTKDSSKYISQDGKARAECFKTPDSSRSRSGRYSAHVIGGKRPYAFSTSTKVYEGDLLHASIWCYGTPTGLLAISAENSDQLYMQSNTVITTDSAGWQQISLAVSVPLEMNGRLLTVYAYVPDNAQCWFDDLVITHYANRYNRAD